MAEATNDIKTISRKNSGFPDWLDFQKLRAEGIAYIGKLSGKIWTDHNIHDPGITILETLCYALTDLGYRTHLPAEDIFARNPDDKTPEDNFLTPLQVLTSNPLTITDYRKLLIDIKGIKNAWLEIATDQEPGKFCKPKEPQDPGTGPILLRSAIKRDDPCCANYLNGLYHVFLDTEKNIEDEFEGRPEEKIKYTSCLVEKVKKALLTHRNICEDFIDIKILCKWKIGVCAEMELEDDADPEKVYVEMIEQLRQFFSPSPRFYTLPQLLEAGKTIEEIFAGRPYDVTDSHGFVDTGEFELLTLRKTIHLSDIYSALFAVKGIRKIQRLRLKDCAGSKSVRQQEWSVKIPQDHVPDFSVECSGFEFNRRGILVSFDFRKYDELLRLNFEHNGKILYTAPSVNLDAAIPKGFYHKELGAYTSIQNDFPRVYGIAEGGLPVTASSERKARALQLKGYLLFFDQLLANYLSQLRNMRSLFSLSATNNKENKHTYFSAIPGAVPDFQELVQYKVNESGDIVSGDSGFLAFPVRKKYIEGLVQNGEIKCFDMDTIAWFRFPTVAERDIAVNQWIEDITAEIEITVHYVTRGDDCVFYYIEGSSNDYVIVGRKYYKDENAARLAVSSLRYAAGIRTSYRSLIIQNGFSFSIDLNRTDYSGFLQALIEDESLYIRRRQSFLDHLLARFAERFTDYALLSYGFYSVSELNSKEIAAKENFLSHYPLLSSTRAKAFDYSADGWHSANNSGFEKRINALLGMDNLKRKSLCNFSVYAYDEKYMLRLALDENTFFKSNEKFDTREEAGQAAARLFDALKERANYRPVQLPLGDKYAVLVNYGGRDEAIFSKDFSSDLIAGEISDRLSEMIAGPVAGGKVTIASYRYTALLKDHRENTLRIYIETPADKDVLKKGALKNINKINDVTIWKMSAKEDKKIGKLLADATIPGAFIDHDEFKIDIDNTIVGKPDKFIYELLDRNNRFKFLSVNEFDTEKKAREDCLHALSFLGSATSLKIDDDKNSAKWSLYICDEHESRIAVNVLVFDSFAQAEEQRNNICEIIRESIYQLKTEPIPDSWKFSFEYGYEPGDIYTAESLQQFATEAKAESALTAFSASQIAAGVEQDKQGWIIAAGEKKKAALARLVNLPANIDEETLAISFVKRSLALQQQIARLKTAREKPEAFIAAVDIHEDSKCRYVYQLVDKDGLYAFYKNAFQSKQEAQKNRKEIIKKNIDDYNLPELYMRGDFIVNERSSVDGKLKWYHYCIATSNTIKSPIGGIAQRLTFFESTKGYSRKEDAEKAFHENYLQILTLGLDKENYGQGKLISEKPLFIHTADNCITSDSIVYVPEKTMAFSGTYPEQSINELIRILHSYPVRTIKKKAQQDEFEKRFLPCKTVPGCEKDTGKSCTDKKENPVFYFVLYDKQTGQEDWQSAAYYETAEAAMKAFLFFRLLLVYEGNYLIDCDCTGSFRIYIREVLAESVNRFETEELAWGKQGVQQFINVSQTSGAFHAYSDERCCYHFFVACKNIRLVHPVKYDSPEKRDEVLILLQKHAAIISKWKFDFYCDTKWNDILRDLEGNELAHVNYIVEKGSWSPATILDGYIDILSYIGAFPLCINEDKNEVFLQIDDKRSIHFTVVAASGIKSLNELRERLKRLTCYFPFAKKEDAKIPAYCIEIRIPGFNQCEECNGEDIFEPPAWVSECCFSSCNSLLSAFNTIVSWLRHFDFYRRIFDCKCGPYGIEIFDDSAKCIERESRQDYNNQNSTIKLSAIIARNPQCYTTAEMVCDAIKRAKHLINAEGLHLVEHILLRPGCEEDCDCVLRPCPNIFDNCKFPYWDEKDEDDPCDITKPVCFNPGNDPYSFIGTVALPAWPERFQREENRILVENMLYREAPAHVALRVLWLTPHDLCCFEQQYKRWLIWIACKKSCIDNYKTCDFVNFLFRRDFECWKNLPGCDTCSIEPGSQQSCVQQIKDEEKNTVPQKCTPQQWTEQLNELYCLRGNNCNDSFYFDCDKTNKEGSQKTRSRGTATSLTDKPGTLRKDTEAIREAVAIKEIPGKVNTPKFVNSRLAGYRAVADTIVADLPDNEFAKKARRLLDAASVSQQEFIVLMNQLSDALVTAKKAETKKLSSLISVVSCFYMDKKIFNGGMDETMGDLKKVYAAIKKKGVDTKSIYRDWKPEEVKEYAADIDWDKLEKVFN